ncbi:MAG: aldo/keto reductase [Immundisolibacterales bacterium]|nr:aldo/keto reductase [Immundisolibacterales bacterium]
MEYRYLGRTGVEVSPVCLGSDDFGDGTPPDLAEKLILRSLDAGINLIDTGNLYAGGTSEAIIGKCLADSGRRNEVLISTKIDHAPRKIGVSLDEHVPRMPPNVQGNSRLNIIRACELSLKALRTDWIDLLQVHRYDSRFHIEETLGALTDLVRQGKVRYAGCSTFPAWKLMHALMLSEMKGYVRFVNEESPYNLLDRRIENELVPLAREHGVGLLTWSPLAHGMLTGAYAEADSYPKNTRAGRRGAFYAARVTAEGIRIGRAFGALARDAGLSPAQLAVLWCKDQPGITAPLVGAGSMAHLEELLAVMEMTLDDSLREACDTLVPPGTHVADFLNTSGWMKTSIG